MPARLVDGHSFEICHSLTRRYIATPFFSHINLQISPLYMMPILNSFRLPANAQCQCNPCVLFCYAVHLFIFVLKHCLTTTYYCARMVMFWITKESSSSFGQELGDSSKCSDWLWGPSSLLLGTTCSFTGVKVARA